MKPWRYATTSKVLKVDLSTEVEALDIYYSWDNSFSRPFLSQVHKRWLLQKMRQPWKPVTYRGKQNQCMMVIPVAGPAETRNENTDGPAAKNTRENATMR